MYAIFPPCVRCVVSLACSALQIFFSVCSHCGILTSTLQLQGLILVFSQSSSRVLLRLLLCEFPADSSGVLPALPQQGCSPAWHIGHGRHCAGFTCISELTCLSCLLEYHSHLMVNYSHPEALAPRSTLHYVRLTSLCILIILFLLLLPPVIFFKHYKVGSIALVYMFLSEFQYSLGSSVGRTFGRFITSVFCMNVWICDFVLLCVQAGTVDVKATACGLASLTPEEFL